MTSYTREEIETLKEIGQLLRENHNVVRYQVIFMLKLIKKLDNKYQSSIKAFTKYVEENK